MKRLRHRSALVLPLCAWLLSLTLGPAVFASDLQLESQAGVLEVPAGPLSEDVLSTSSNQSNSNFVCPNANNYCNAEYNYCEDRCYDAGPNVSQDCLEACDDDFDSCYFGEPAFVTTGALTASRFNGPVCGKRGNRARRVWDSYSVTCQFTRRERRLCRSTGQWYDLGVDSSYPSSRECYERPPVQFGCSPAMPFVGTFGNDFLCGTNICQP